MTKPNNKILNKLFERKNNYREDLIETNKEEFIKVVEGMLISGTFAD